ncbi:hypothetical protein DRF65_16565 [Chryseobacterium pennae]|uniref:Carboxypeptidase regulatory-like domain-containing protein n=1 Tax=Chryseobacterium pennae TaxID=2258962 RepID=A0A3D9C612_9FLAO|nr:carboxypeptidase-like regulatory domain-containing protein [Chryseobacterium pennae]REC61327.1 hypothetical protein DRF65_16565 [Chryseobacterium pennae]
MKKISLILIGILLISLSFTTKEKYSIWGRLVDHNYNPIEKFKIEIYQDNNQEIIQKLSIINENGEFLLKDLPPSTYEIRITVEKYTRYSTVKKIVNKNISVGEIALQNSW